MPDGLGFRLLFDAVLVLPLPDAVFNQGGKVHIPDGLTQTRHLPRFGRVLMVGNGHRRKGSAELIPLSVAKGDKVAFTNMAGQEVWVDLDGKKEVCRAIREADVIAVVEED